MSSSNDVQIAMIGLAAELPGGAGSAVNLDVDSFFEFLLNKGEAYETIPSDRFNIDKLKGRGQGQIITDSGSFLKDIRMFDYLEFGMTHKDVLAMPVATRKLIETTFLALFDSGIHYRGQNVGCYMAGVGHDPLAISGHDEGEIRGSFAGGIATVANRVSYHLDLRGPSIPTDTACSSSLVATHMAVQALRNGECETAVVGGAQLNHRFSEWLFYCMGGILSPDGKCKPFDASANGFCRAEGVVSMVLKPLDVAIRDHDKVYGLVLGTGINSSGSLAPANAPVAASQQDAMKRAFAMAKRKPQEVDFLELHATGTASGDPTEANWVGEQFKRDDELILGSLKGNVGHLEISSFLGSLVKVVGMFRTGLIAPNVNLTIKNPSIHWDEYKFRVPLEVEPLPARSPSGRSLVAMTSSGITGVNGHAVIESPPPFPVDANTFWLCGADVPGLVIAGGLSPRSALAVAESIQELIESCHSSDLSRIYGRRSRSLTWRSFSVANGGKLQRFSEPALIPKTTPPLVFVFSGQGPQHFEMGRGLFQTSTVFRSTVLELEAVHRKAAGYSLIERYGLFGDAKPDTLGDVWPIAVTLPALAILHIALFDTLVSAGVKPDIVLGHSAGETSALYASGSGSKALAVELAIARGKAMALLEDKFGTMAAVSCSPEQAQAIIVEVIKELGPGSLEVGCYNTPGSITLSGLATHIDLAVSKALDAGIFARRLRTRVPVHSTMMDLCEKEYKALSKEVFAKYETVAPSVKTYTTLDGKESNEPFTSEYFWNSTRGPVRFTQAMQALTASHPGATYIEISPHPVLSSYLSIIADKDSTVTAPMKRSKNKDQLIEVTDLLETLGKVVVAGHNTVNFDVMYNGLGDRKEPPLMFPFARKDLPYNAPSLAITKQKQHRNGPMNYPQLQMNVKTHPGLADHWIKDEPIMPAAGYIEMALEFGARRLWNVQFISILGLSSETPTPINVDLEGNKWTVKSAAPGDQHKVWPMRYDRVHATGYLSRDATGIDDKAMLNIPEIRARMEEVGMKDFYKGLSGFAQYGKMYQRITACHRGVNPQGYDEFLVQVRGNEADLRPELDEYRIHPAILDAAVHTAVHPMITGYKVGPRYYLPSKFHLLVIHEALDRRPFPKSVYSRLTLVGSTPSSLTYDCAITDESGLCLLTMQGLQVALHGNFVRKVATRYEVLPAEIGILVSRTLRSLPETPKEEYMDPVVLEYVRGEEMELQKSIVPLDALISHSVWFHATSGPNGDAAMGFTRSLAREFPAWTVRVVVFDASWTSQQRFCALHDLFTHPDLECELYIDAAGTVTAPRITESAPPVSRIPFNPELPWVKEVSHLVHVSEPEVPPQRFAVQVTGSSAPISNIWSYVGHVKGSSRRVVGITTGPLTNVVIAHKGSIMEVPNANAAVPDALAHIIVGLAVGHAVYNEERLISMSIAMEDEDAALTAQVASLCSKLGVSATIVPRDPSLSDLEKLSATQSSVIIAGSRSDGNSQLKDFVSPGGKVFYWSDAELGIPAIQKADPWMVGDALHVTAQRTTIQGSYVAPLEIAGVDLTKDVEVRSQLFFSEKTYMLVGGIGSLGMEIAHWMYKNGARHIVLTSRSGRDSVAKKGSFLSKRLLSYLDTLPDLALRLVAADALSVCDMSNLIRSLEKPLGGCMLLSVVLVDRSFAAQTKETFETPHIPKAGAFKVLENIVAFDSLDFLITFSSVSGMFGNAGQTNYASANTTLAGLTKAYRRGFCLIVPGILDSYVALHDDTYANRFNHLANWGMTSAELCESIGDGIRKLRDAPIWQYVPDFNWNLVHANMGPSPMYAHLVTDGGTGGDDGKADQPASLKEIVCKTLNVPIEDLSPEVPFTAYGLDSLSAASLSYALAPVIRISQIQLLADITLKQLEQRLEAEPQAKPSATTKPEEVQKQKDSRAEAREVKVKEMWAAVEKYTAMFSSVGNAASIPRPARKTVLVTGSTGSLGSHTLEKLLQSQDVEKVYAFVRSRSDLSAAERQSNAFKSRGLDVAALKYPKLTVLDGTLAAPALGLKKDVYDQLMSTVTDIAHFGWTVDFVMPLTRYEDDLRGLRGLLELALGNGKRAPANFVFAGSAALFRNLEGLDMPDMIPEDFIREPALAIGNGYTESKWVAELIIAAAAEKTPLQPSVIRVTQLTGGRNGAWKESEWFPSMIATSVALGCLPQNHDSCAWMDVDTAAAAGIDMLDSQKPVLHLQHSHPKPFNEILAPISATLNLPLVNYTKWLDLLGEASAKVSRGELKATAQLQTGLRLIDIFRSFLRKTEVDSEGSYDVHINIEMNHSLKESKTLQNANFRKLDDGDVQRWLAYWRSIGLLPLQ